jgi:hypothetical protein
VNPFKLRPGTLSRRHSYYSKEANAMLKFLLWCILLILCWPLALAVLILYPLVWLLLLPFRLVGIAVGGVLELVRAIFMLPGRLVRAI